ncbi:MAG TPA: hypothetical protein VEU33_39540 [Archangium sp.]|nr:hypothetical protein [Archangium sp.]
MDRETLSVLYKGQVPTSAQAAPPLGSQEVIRAYNPTLLGGAQRAVREFGEGLINGRPGAASGLQVDVSKATDQRILHAQNMTPAESFGVRTREMITTFVPFRSMSSLARRRRT